MDVYKALGEEYATLEKEYCQLEKMKRELDEFKNLDEPSIEETTVYILIEKRMKELETHQERLIHFGNYANKG